MKIPRIRRKGLFDSLCCIRLDYSNKSMRVSAILEWRELELFEMIRTSWLRCLRPQHHENQSWHSRGRARVAIFQILRVEFL